MIIDCHGHYTTAPASRITRGARTRSRRTSAARPRPPIPRYRTTRLVESIELNQLRLLKERGADMTIFSPRASAMEHHVGDEVREHCLGRGRATTSSQRVVDLYPDAFIGVCQLPQSPGVGTQRTRLEELERCVNELGFVGLNLNPDPSGGMWTGPPLTDQLLVPDLRERWSNSTSPP
jgi:4-oxalmesaconate hydratase